MIRVRGVPLNGIFGPCACLLAGGCGAWRLLARRRRRRRRRRHSVPVPLGGHFKKIFHEKYTMVTQPKGIKSPVHPFEKWEMHPEEFVGNVLPTKSLCCPKT